VVGLGMMVMNVLAYGFTLLAAHTLGPSTFGAVAALLGVIIVANVGSLTIQATAARRLATTEPRDLDGVRREIVRSGSWLSVGLGLLLLIVVPLLDKALQLDDRVATAMVAPTCAALTLMGAFAGMAQGERRWGALAAIYLAMGVGRIAGGGTALLVDTSARSAMIGVAAGSVLPLLVGWRLCPAAPAASSGDRPVLSELWRNGHTLLAFFAFTNLDILLARHQFSHHQAGIYAGGAILTKTCLFLTTFVLVVAFPSMASERAGRPWAKPVLVVLGLGACAVLGTLLLPDLAESFAGGSTYAGLGRVAWVFALEGTTFAVLQILVYDTIAGQRHAAILLWAGVIGVAAVAMPTVHSVDALAGIVAGAAAAVGLAIAALPGLRGLSGRAPQPGSPP
jgi:O-antigen/teichoic acid export membrane protein